MNKWFLLCIAIFMVSCASYKGEQDFTKKVDIKYGKNERHLGDLYQVKNKNAPLIFVVHGGGWRGRAKEDMDGIAESLASNGFNVFNINYRLAPKYRHPAPIKDLQQAVEFVKKKYKFENNKIGLWGYSAGAHISLMYGLQNSNVSAIVSGGAPYDFSWYAESPYIGPYLGFFRKGKIKEYLEASPISYIKKTSPPMFLYHGIKDDLVEHAQMRVFYTKTQLKDLNVKTHTIGFWGHINTFVFASEPIEKGVKFLKSTL